MTQSEQNTPAWRDQVYDSLKAAGVEILAYVPDAGHSRAIQRAVDDPAMEAIVLTTEEEGVALAAGAWAGGKKAALLMQSSGVGNCINMLALIKTCRFPFLTLVTMRGDYGEGNPWQYPMGQAVDAVLEAMGMLIFRVDSEDELEVATRAALSACFSAGQGVALILSQRFLGAKAF